MLPSGGSHGNASSGRASCEELECKVSERAVIRLSPETVPRGRGEAEEVGERLTETVERGLAVEEGDGVSGEGVLARLRSRVEQQSTLIAMLKQRADETLRQLECCQGEVKESCSRRQAAEQKLHEEVKARTLVEKRFAILAKNHEELILIKDEYKSANSSLVVENQRLQQECESGRLSALREEESWDLRLEEERAACRGKEREAANECEALKRQVHVLTVEAQEERERRSAEMSQLRASLIAGQQTQERLEQSLEDENEKVTGLKKEVHSLKCSCEKLEREVEEKCARLEAEEAKLQLAETEAEEARTRFEERVEEVSRDARVCVLNKELSAARERGRRVEREFSAYKKHSAELLHQEKELNSRLRHLTQ